MHSLCVYNQSLTTASESRLFGYVVRELDFCPNHPGLGSFMTTQSQFFGETVLSQTRAPILRHQSRNKEK